MGRSPFICWIGQHVERDDLSSVEFAALTRLALRFEEDPERGLPNENTKLAPLAKCDIRTWRKCRPKVLQEFNQRPDGRWELKLRMKDAPQPEDDTSED